jgi:hypothetical protein
MARLPGQTKDFISRPKAAKYEKPEKRKEISMLRKALFGGLTVMLAAVLIWLIIKGRQQEARLAAAPGEIVKAARSTSTRVVAPNDLEAVISQEASGSGLAPRSLGKVTLRNRGGQTYHSIMLMLSFVDAGGKILGTKNHLVQESVGPGQTCAAGEISTDNAPGGTTRCDVKVLYSEFGSATGRPISIAKD